jgi:DNA-directed RNA polymerase I subunit RPA2
MSGQFVDATPFKKCTPQQDESKDGSKKQKGTHGSAVDEFGKQLADYGFNYHGTEVMYSGLLGTELTCEIYMGVVYYQRLRHMVSDKYQVKSLHLNLSFLGLDALTKCSGKQVKTQRFWHQFL